MAKARIMILLIGLLTIFTGCATVSTTGMLEYDKTKKELKVDDIKFSILKKKGIRGSYINMTKKAMEYYPNLFLDDLTSLPIHINLNCRSKSTKHDEGAILYGLTLGLLPAPLDSDMDYCSGFLELSGIEGELFRKNIEYSFDKMRWVPGIPFLPLAPIVHSRKDFSTLEEQTLIEYAVQSINEAEPAKLKDAYDYRKNRLHKINIYGKTYWVFVGLVKSSESEKNNKGYDIALASFFNEYPEILSNPIESVVIAKKDEKGWREVSSIPRKLNLKKLTMVSGKIINNRPVKIDIHEDVKPRVEYFIFLTNPNDYEEIRWSNNMLVEAKNLTFVEDLKNKSKDELIKLLTDLEKELLILSEKLSKLELILQQKLVNKESTIDENTLIPIYQQRINLFEALILTVKQAIM